jgi:hypothetical protein
MKTWEEAINDYSSRLTASHSFRAGYRAGWLDAGMKRKSIMAATSRYGYYSDGYKTGQRDRRATNEQPVKPKF